MADATPSTTPSPGLSPDLLEILVCPEDKGPLVHLPEEGVLYNPRLRRAYEIRDGIPVMLVDEAREVDDTEHDRFVSALKVGADPADDAAE